ncbi:golgin subfamily A member 1 [Erpetoichthys calabaricus]|uniref:golgin subfamily A member 1 n=1 Tax=Erpetoichthys calabaricus TaxID=27687 RepID=UPI002234475A|nr:golgin subfamily A member 1 [Erpetoichthys calabaricus]XP_051787935.1 golgin subfamily A member 1 [Erpetoichthys calabaricus]
MFTKLKKKIAEEAATAPRLGGPAGRIPRSVSRESITSAGADSGDDFASDGSSSREDLSSQLLRKDEKIRKLEAKLADCAEQLRNTLRIKEKLEIALEKHQDSTVRKLQEQNEAYQGNYAKMAEAKALALEKKDLEWRQKFADLQQENEMLSARLNNMKEQSLSFFQKRDDIDELEGFQQQELAKLKHMLLRKEEVLTQKENELSKHIKDLNEARVELKTTSEKLSHVEEKHQELKALHLQLQQEREQLLSVKVEAEKKITELEQRGLDLQNVIQQVSQDSQKAQNASSILEKTLTALQAEHEALKLEHEQHKQKTAVTVEEKDKIVGLLQVKVSSLEKRVEGNLSEDEHLQELLKEKSFLEQKLEETRQELLETKTSHSEINSILEAQLSKLNSKVAELQTLLKYKDESAQSFKDKSQSQINELEQALQEVSDKLKASQDQVNEKESEIKKQTTDAEDKNNKFQQQIAACRHQSAEKISRLEAQITVLETAKEFDKTAAQHKISQLQQEKEDLQERIAESEHSLNRLVSDLKSIKVELSSKETVSTEIAKALEEMRKQREDLQLQVVDLTTALTQEEKLLSSKTAQLNSREEEINNLKEDLNTTQVQLTHLQTETEKLKSAMTEKQKESENHLSKLKEEVQSQSKQREVCERRVVDLEAEVQMLNGQLHPPGAEHNGPASGDAIAQLQKCIKELEQQNLEKNKTIKQLQQRLVELKKTFQKELKIKHEVDCSEVKERLCSEPPMLVSTSTTVTNNSDLNDSREINFEYLKHVVLKFMSSREAEAYQLIKAVSVLLNFTREEEDMLKETLDYKMSWFGSKPSPRGIIRPSISGAPSHWN